MPEYCTEGVGWGGVGSFFRNQKRNDQENPNRGVPYTIELFCMGTSLLSTEPRTAIGLGYVAAYIVRIARAGPQLRAQSIKSVASSHDSRNEH